MHILYQYTALVTIILSVKLHGSKFIMYLRKEKKEMHGVSMSYMFIMNNTAD